MTYDPAAQDQQHPDRPQQPYPHRGGPEYGAYPTSAQPYAYPPVQTPGPPARKRSNRGTIVVAIVAVAVGLCGTGLVIAALTHGNSSTTTTTGGPGPAAGIPGWRDGGGATLITKLGDDFTAISDDAKKLDVTAMHGACLSLQTDVEAAQAYQQIPDQQAEAAWAQALALYARAATDCVAGTTGTGDPTLITKAGTELGQGSTQMSAVTARMRVLAGT